MALMKAQSNLIMLASRGINIENVEADHVIHLRRAEDMRFKSSLFETLQIILESHTAKNIDIFKRFALANFYHWLRKNKAVSAENVETLIKQILPILVNVRDQNHQKINNFGFFF